MSRSVFTAVCLRAVRPPQVAFRRNFAWSSFLRAEASTDGPAVTATNRAQFTAKRFWKTVDVEEKPDGLVVTLDKRPLKTPAGKTLTLPKSKRLLAALIAHEWDNQDSLIKPFALPMTSLAARAIDSFHNEEERQKEREALIRFLDTDTICFISEKPAHPTATDNPKSLLELQEKHWAPLLEWARKEFNTDVRQFESVMITSQPKETKDAIRRVFNSLDPWQFAALERAVYSARSVIIALALIRGHLSVENAAKAAQVEVMSQIQNWGEVEDTHDVDYQEMRRQLGSAASLLV